MPVHKIARAGLPSTEKQQEMVQNLVDELYADKAEGAAFIKAHHEEGTFKDRRDTSELIGALLERKQTARVAKVVAGGALPDPGYYAVEYKGVLGFYSVKLGRGKHAGSVFVNKFKSDARQWIPMAEQKALRNLIMEAPETARMRFAEETRHCYACGRRLTDAESRDRGIGPECLKLRAVV